MHKRTYHLLKKQDKNISNYNTIKGNLHSRYDKRIHQASTKKGEKIPLRHHHFTENKGKIQSNRVQVLNSEMVRKKHS